MRGPILDLTIDPTDTGMIDLNKWKLWIAIYGPICAKWLVTRFRASVKRGGGFDVTVPHTVKLMSANWRWFKLAYSFMRQTKRWRVRIKRQATGDLYEFRWLLFKGGR